MNYITEKKKGEKNLLKAQTKAQTKDFSIYIRYTVFLLRTIESVSMSV